LLWGEGMQDIAPYGLRMFWTLGPGQLLQAWGILDRIRDHDPAVRLVDPQGLIPARWRQPLVLDSGSSWAQGSIPGLEGVSHDVGGRKTR
jgi:hypothetical protein